MHVCVRFPSSRGVFCGTNDLRNENNKKEVSDDGVQAGGRAGRQQMQNV